MTTRLLYARLERAHQRDNWESLRLHHRHTHDWFLVIQRHLVADNMSSSTVVSFLMYLTLISQSMHNQQQDVVNNAILDEVVQQKQNCNRALPQIQRRIYRTANLVFGQILGELDRPLVVRRIRVRRKDDDDDRSSGMRVFTDDEIMRLFETAHERMDLRTEVLLQLLFTSGLRIGAVAGLQWSSLLTEEGAVKDMVVVREKGGQRRFVLLTSSLKSLLKELKGKDTAGDGKYVFPICVRTLRSHFARQFFSTP